MLRNPISIMPAQCIKTIIHQKYTVGTTRAFRLLRAGSCTLSRSSRFMSSYCTRRAPAPTQHPAPNTATVHRPNRSSILLPVPRPGIHPAGVRCHAHAKPMPNACLHGGSQPRMRHARPTPARRPKPGGEGLRCQPQLRSLEHFNHQRCRRRWRWHPPEQPVFLRVSQGRVLLPCAHRMETS